MVSVRFIVEWTPVQSRQKWSKKFPCKKFTRNPIKKNQCSNNISQTFKKENVICDILLKISKMQFMFNANSQIMILRKENKSYTAWKVSKYGPEKIPYLDTFHTVNSRRNEKQFFLISAFISWVSRASLKR